MNDYKDKMDLDEQGRRIQLLEEQIEDTSAHQKMCKAITTLVTTITAVLIIYIVLLVLSAIGIISIFN